MVHLEDGKEMLVDISKEEVEALTPLLKELADNRMINANVRSVIQLFGARLLDVAHAFEVEKEIKELEDGFNDVCKSLRRE